MGKRITLVGRIVTGLLLVGIGAGAVVAATSLDLFRGFGIDRESHDTQVIRALERTQEVSLISLGVQGIKEQSESSTVFGKSIPGTGKSTFLQYDFTAKLGVDGGKVGVERTGEKAYLITLPEFGFIGYDEPRFKVAVEDGGPLSWVTTDIDQVEMVNEILNDEAREVYLETYEQDLKDQAEVFYGTLIAGIDPGIRVDYEFAS